ncbi:ABC transporter ATP-binding protein [Streptomyces sp. NPDC101249]|jgi:branched-chain amino acid transport system ATP-binding protein|uniref:ABC transporter ATP-binding protein n=1 Tax=unclassified Streptomyces TaxID=2593676 RepID=UPI00380D3AFD
MLQLLGLTAGYHGGTVLHGVDLTVAAGTVHAVVGRNGAGKTTLVHTVAGLLRPASGRVLLDGLDLAGRPAHRIARAGVGLVPQGRRVFASLTVAEHLRLAHRPPRSADRPGVWTPERVLGLLPRLGERLGTRGANLSGGEQQMLALARALLSSPRVLLLDEPTEGLSPELADRVHALARTSADEGMAVLLVCPSPAQAIGCADTLTVLTSGRTALRMDGAAARADAAPLRAALDLTPARD